MKMANALRRICYPAAVTAALCAAFALAGCQRSDVGKGQASLGLGDYPMALRFFGQAVESDPQDYEARLGMGQALLQKSFAEGDSGAFAYAMVQLEACRSLRPSQDLSGLLAEAYTEKARSLLLRKDTVTALASLSKAIDRDPANPQPLNLVGIVYGRLGESDKAEGLFRKALELDSNDASAHFNLGMIFWQAGGFKEAHAHWLRALKALPGDEDVLYWFALSEKKLMETP